MKNFFEAEAAILKKLSLNYQKPIHFIIACDEVGRGCIAGPVYSAISLWQVNSFSQNPIWLAELKDSKKITEAKRVKLFHSINEDFIQHPKYKLFLSRFVTQKWNTADFISENLNHSELVLSHQRFGWKDLTIPKSGKAPVALSCLGFAIGEASANEIESLNILNATHLAASRALVSMQTLMPHFFSSEILENILFLVDGKTPFRVTSQFVSCPQVTLVDGDNICRTIAFSSIVAKVLRDTLLITMHKEFPEFQFEKHKGYGTKQHMEKISQFGLIENFHRRSFIKEKYLIQK